MRPEELKQKLRQLKRLEEKIRFGGGSAQPAGRLVWNDFFDTCDIPLGRARYSLNKLAAMSKEAYKAAVDEYLAYVYYELYKENDATLLQGGYDPEILKKLGLPSNAGAQDIKRKFRELAKKYHPDTGGDTVKFIELMDIYTQLKARK
jgi:DnaJ-domain-containing protein 1